MARKPRIQTPTGMHDILPKDQPYYRKIYDVTDDIAKFYGFERIDTPMVENLELYERGTGTSTDIVEKQMFTLKTRGGDILALRPEFTPGITRSYIEHGMHNLPQRVKLYTYGQLFRYEHPQAGRFRQFNQIDLEVFGEESPAIDAQVIQIFYAILSELKFKDLIIKINSIGDSQCRPYYRKVLSAFLKSNQYALCADCRRRMKQNPLRVLDCKEEKCQRIRSQAPQMIDHLNDECKRHFKSVLEFLDETELPYHLDPYLVRGLDYYTKTVFEIYTEESSDEEKDSQSALVGGGRYDTLMKQRGGRDTPGMGAAAGVERMVLEMKARGDVMRTSKPRVFLAQLGDLPKKKALKLMEELRKADIDVAESLGRDSLRVQLGRADRIGVDLALILGQKEALEESIVIRTMSTGKQDTVKLERVVTEIKKRLK